MDNNVNRRDFLQSSLAVGAGAVLAQDRFVSAQNNSSSEELNCAIIGFGAEGKVLISSCVKIPNLRFKAVCDIWDYRKTYGQRLLMKYGHEPNAYRDYREMLEKEDDLDAVIIATPDWMHAEQTNACLEKGINVYCEKMMSNDVDEARSMVRTMKKTGNLLQIGHQRRSNPRYHHALNKLLKQADLLGRITNINGHWNRGVSEALGWPEKYTIPEDILQKYGYENMHQFRNWRWYKKYGGGPICDLGSHQIDIYSWFLGTTPKSVMASGGINYYDYEWYDNIMTVYEYDTPDGVVRAYYEVLTTTSAGGGRSINFMGTDGTLKMSENPAYSKVYREPRVDEEKWAKWVRANYISQDTVPDAEANAGKVDVRETAPLAVYDLPVELKKPIHMPHLENFFAAVRGEAELNCPADHAFESEVPVWKVNEAVPAKCTLEFKPSDFAV